MRPMHLVAFLQAIFAPKTNSVSVNWYVPVEITSFCTLSQRARWASLFNLRRLKVTRSSERNPSIFWNYFCTCRLEKNDSFVIPVPSDGSKILLQKVFRVNQDLFFRAWLGSVNRQLHHAAETGLARAESSLRTGLISSSITIYYHLHRIFFIVMSECLENSLVKLRKGQCTIKRKSSFGKKSIKNMQ